MKNARNTNTKYIDSKLKLTWNCLTCGLRHLFGGITSTFIIWIEEGLALCLAPMSRSRERKEARLPQ